MQPLPNKASDLPRRGRAIRAAGWLIILLSAGSALLPLVEPRNGATIIALLLVVAGIVELFAGTLRHEARGLAMLAGAVTVGAGLLFWTEQATHFLPTLSIIAGWLFLRSVILALAARQERGSVRWWTGLSAATDFFLALLLAVGISIATFVVTLFGPTPPMVASFAWVLALSFISDGLLQLEIANCAESEDV